MTARMAKAGWVAALIALAMLSYAVVQSSVMQVAMAVPAAVAPLCDGAMAMSGMAVAAGDAGRHAPAKPTPSKACPYCAAAAHPPIVACVFFLPRPTSVVFPPMLSVAVRGPRGPPSFRPRSRGPPAPLL